MPKVKRAGAPSAVRRYAEDAYGRILGSDIAPHSVTPDRLRVRNLAEFVANLGVVTAGTFIAGTLGAGRIIIGDLGGGLQLRDATERTTGAMTTDGNLRFGLLDTPGMTMIAGVLDMHGGAIRAHTIDVDKLIVGEMAAGFIRSDVILVGSGNPDDLTTVTGGVLTRDFFGGRVGGRETWRSDNATGHIITALPTDTTGLTYTEMGSGGLILSNYFTSGEKAEEVASTSGLVAYRRAGLTLRAFTSNPFNGLYEQSDILMYGISGVVYMVNATGANAPQLQMTDSAGVTAVMLGQSGLRINDGMSSIILGRGLNGSNLDLMLDTVGMPLRIGATGSAVLELREGQAGIAGGCLTFDDTPDHPWPQVGSFLPNQAAFGIDPVSREPYFWDGTQLLKLLTGAWA